MLRNLQHIYFKKINILLKFAFALLCCCLGTLYPAATNAQSGYIDFGPWEEVGFRYPVISQDHPTTYNCTRDHDLTESSRVDLQVGACLVFTSTKFNEFLGTNMLRRVLAKNDVWRMIGDVEQWKTTRDEGGCGQEVRSFVFKEHLVWLYNIDTDVSVQLLVRTDAFTCTSCMDAQAIISRGSAKIVLVSSAEATPTLIVRPPE